ncbi:MAG: hypothetical protein Q9222_002864 [Ikaeria aurantiellina]
MSLNIKHLNGDTTFLLTFSPAESRPLSIRYGRPPGTFSVLIDPWLSGPSSMWHPKFLLSKHTVPSCISNLSHIPEPNVVLISQDKPDHCHEPTLRQLDPSSNLTNVLAVPGAAKKIRGMKHFNPTHVHALPIFSSKDRESVIRFYIPPLSPAGAPGEATIAFIPAKLDLSGLHSALGITYRPPTAAAATPPPPPIRYFPLPTDHCTTYSNFNSPNPSAYQPANNMPLTPPDSPPHHTRSRSLSTSTDPSSTVSTTSTALSPAISHTTSATTPSASTTRISSSHTHTHSPSYSSTTSSNPNHHFARPAKTLSLIYSPHGLAYSPHLIPYATTHLVPHAALPLTALIHGFDRVENPWYMGGNVNAGLPGGVEIAKALMARCWIGAHDEEKENSGLAVLKLRMRKFGIGEVREMVRREWRGGGGGCEVRVLDVGEEMVLRS